ncbi:hypothetical protein DSECCO2_257010 [anaerobic digester metagenome]
MGNIASPGAVIYGNTHINLVTRGKPRVTGRLRDKPSGISSGDIGSKFAVLTRICQGSAGSARICSVSGDKDAVARAISRWQV